VTRPRAADDYPAIRARMEELRQERARAPADDSDTRMPGGPPAADRSSGLSPIMRRGVSTGDPCAGRRAVST
jgi:hypothetical protein